MTNANNTNSLIIPNRTATWNSIGKSVEECKDLNSVLIASGLDYEVEKVPVQLESGLLIPDRFATVRPNADGSAHIYDIVSDKFEIIQNRDAFDFVNYMGDEVQFEKAGETASGMVYIIAKLPDVDVLGDAFTPHIIFRNGFNGKVKITAAICPLRIICQNQFAMSFKNTENTVTVRHVSNAEAKLAEAREILKTSADFMAELTTTASRYASFKFNKKQIAGIIDRMFPMPADNANAFQRFNMEQARNQFIAAYNHDDNSNFKGTAWGLINAYTDFITHKDPAGKTATRFENRFIQTSCKPFVNDIITVIDSVAA